MANAQVGVRFIENSRGSRTLIHNDYLFSLKNNKGDRSYWKCVNKDCTAKINLKDDIPTKVNFQHVVWFHSAMILYKLVLPSIYMNIYGITRVDIIIILHICCNVLYIHVNKFAYFCYRSHLIITTHVIQLELLPPS